MNRAAGPEARMQQEFDRLARVTRAWFGSQRRREQPPAWLVLERAMVRRRRRTAGLRAVGGLALACAAVVAGIGLRGLLRPDAALTYRLSSGASDGGGGTAQVTGAGTIHAVAGQGALLSFSDGSQVVLQPEARGRVLSTSAHGARVQLDGGRARFSIRHLPGAEWSVAAGPFTVVVHGTVFDLGWSSAGEELQVGLVTGAVTVRGPIAGGAVAVRPGQRLTARASTGETRIDRLAEASATMPGTGVAEPGAVSPMGEPRPVEPATAQESPRVGSVAAEPPVRAKSPTAVQAVRTVSASWAARVASGAFRGVVTDAHMLGIDRCLSLAPAASLAALADASRYARRPELSRRALLAERRRFAGSAGAHDAAFLLGRLADDASGDRREALRWYDRYLEEAGSAHDATYAAEALGRRMLALERLGRGADARAAAVTYLQGFPDGPHAGRAERLTRR